MNETGSRLVISGMHADGNNNSKSNSGEVMLIKFDDDDFTNGQVFMEGVGSGYGSAGGNSLDIDANLR